MKKLNNNWFDKHVEIIGIGIPKKEIELTKENLKNGLNESFKKGNHDKKKSP